MDAAITSAIDRLADAGFDLVHAFDAADAAREPGWEFLGDGPLRTGLLVCNTRALWPRFVTAMRDPALEAERDPLDRYTERSVEAAFPGAPVYFGHREYKVAAPREHGGSAPPDHGGSGPRALGGSAPPDHGGSGPRAHGGPTPRDNRDSAPRDVRDSTPAHTPAPAETGTFLPFARLAVATGLGARAASNLVIHPIYGPWFALRAVVLVEGDPPARAPITSPCTCGNGCKTALVSAGASSTWEAWLAVRDACSLRAWRYSDEQIRYHYTKEWIPPVETP